VLLMATLFGIYPFLLKLYADGGYQGAGFQEALRTVLNRVTSRSSSAPIKRSASSSCPNAGSSNGPSPGSDDAEGSPRIGNASIAKHSYCATITLVRRVTRLKR
jgi:hypothetical protein